MTSRRRRQVAGQHDGGPGNRAVGPRARLPDGRPSRASVASAADPTWTLRRIGDDPAARARDASRFALANGSLGVRGGAEETPDGAGGCFLAGVCERHSIEFHERLPGFVRGTDTRVPVADGTGIALVPGDDPDAAALDADADATGADATERFECALDLRTGVLRRSRTLRTPQGARLRIERERVVAHDRDLLAIRFRVISIDYDGALILRSLLRSGGHAAKQGDDPRIGSAGSRELDTLSCAADATGAILVQRTLHSAISVACAQAHRSDDDNDGIAFLRADPGNALDDDRGDEGAAQQFIVRLRPGADATLEKFVAYAHAGGAPGRDTEALRDAATAQAKRAADAGYTAIASFLVASWLPRLGYRKAMMLGLGLVAAACFALSQIPAFWMVKAMLATVGVAFALVKVSVYSSIGLLAADKQRHASLTSFVEGCFMLGVLSGPWIFGHFIQRQTAPTDPAWLSVFLWLGVACVATIALLAFSTLDEREARDARAPARPSDGGAALGSTKPRAAAVSRR